MPFGSVWAGHLGVILRAEKKHVYEPETNIHQLSARQTVDYKYCAIAMSDTKTVASHESIFFRTFGYSIHGEGTAPVNSKPLRPLGDRTNPTKILWDVQGISLT